MHPRGRRKRTRNSATVLKQKCPAAEDIEKRLRDDVTELSAFTNSKNR